MTRAVQAEIDTGALRHNLRQARNAAPDSRIMAVIKANGYGHGMTTVAGALAEADAYAVACVDEAAALREAGIDKPLVVLEGVFDADELDYAAQQGLEVVVHNEQQLTLLEQQHPGRPLTVWLKIDTGMHRLGFRPEDCADAYRRLTRCDAVATDIRLMTHLANADDPASPRTADQLERFAHGTEGMEGARSAANSGAILHWPDAHLQWVRPGIMLYGVSPFTGRSGADDNLEPAMTLSTRLIAVNRQHRGAAVGYGGTWICPEDMPVGVAAIGYGDGYPRHAPSGTPVLVNGQRAPLIGRVSMDMICIDLRDQPDASVGDPVTLWGRELPVEEIASAADTIAYELLCGVTQRVRFTVK